MKIRKLLAAAMLMTLLAVLCLAACGGQDAAENDNDALDTADISYIEQTEIGDETVIEDEAVALAEAPATPGSVLKPVASGSKVKKSARAAIDYSNTGDGYVMVNFTDSTSKRLKVQVTGSTTTYTYNITPKSWTTFPLSDGNGNYKVTVFENVSDNKYTTVLSESFSVKLKDEFAPFIRPNQYVNYENATNTIKKAAELTSGTDDTLEKVGNVYEFVVNHLSYDKEKAKNVQSGYLPNLDQILAGDKGICFDYAALMTGMLRSQGIPCKLVVGYAGTAYHAWISVWSAETGWVDGAIYFNGTTWQRMDPTFISSGKGSEAIKQFVGDGSNYTQKYLY